MTSLADAKATTLEVDGCMTKTAVDPLDKGISANP
jgi:hypothetical protein